MKSYPCNQMIKNRRKIDETSIEWVFAAGDEHIASRSRVSLGDYDPKSGEQITDRSLFREYNRMVANEVKRNVKIAHPRTVARNPEQVRKEKDEIRDAFAALYGYEPDEESVRYLYEQKHSRDYLLSIDPFFESPRQDESSGMEWEMRDPSAQDAFETIENEEIQQLREYVSGLNPRQQDVYLAMLMQYDGGGLWIRQAELAEKWGVTVQTIINEQKRIIAGIREAVRGGEEKRI